MPQLYDPSFLPPVWSRDETITIPVPGNSDITYTFTFHVSESGDYDIARRECEQRLLSEYVYGVPVVVDKKSGKNETRKKTAKAGNDLVNVTPQLCEYVAALMTADRTESEKEDGTPLPRWKENQWFALSHRAYSVFIDAVACIFGLMEDRAKELNPALHAETDDEAGNVPASEATVPG